MTIRKADRSDTSLGQVQEQLSAYRVLRRELEQAVLPLASSLDGLTFELQASLYDLPYRCGGYVVLESQSGSRLGQVVDLEMSRYATGAGGAPGARKGGRLPDAQGR